MRCDKSKSRERERKREEKICGNSNKQREHVKETTRREKERKSSAAQKRDN